MKINLDSSSSEWQFAMRLAEKTNESFFLTGKAGTGKTTFIKQLVQTIKKKIIVIAPTGIAALNVGGVTIHSIFKLPFGPLEPQDKRVSTHRISISDFSVLKNADIIIIDEVSMVRADVMDAIDWSLRQITGKMDKKFGGKQMIFCGDLFQLPPVDKPEERSILSKNYQPNFYFFYSKVLSNCPLIKIELKKVFRQTDHAFIHFLDKLRDNTITDEEIKNFNDLTSYKGNELIRDYCVILAIKNEIADRINESRLKNLNGESRTYHAKISGKFPESMQPTNSELELKIGAQVVLLRNDPELRWANGTMGYIVELGFDFVKVRLKNGTIQTITACEWENIGYTNSNLNGSIKEQRKGLFTQLPIKLAWAMTIHKSQGLTFDDVLVDLGQNAFASGQTYVALSRAKSIDGLSLIRPLRRADIIVDEQIKNYTHDFDNPEVIEQITKGKNAKATQMCLIELLKP